MRRLTPKQEWVLNYLRSVTCASEHELAKNYTALCKPWKGPSMWCAFNMQKTLQTLMKRCLVLMERNPTTNFRYYSVV